MKKSTHRLKRKEFRDLLLQVFELNEKPLNDQEKKGVFSLDHAVIAKSGYSVGRIQTDFSVKRKARKELCRFLDQSGSFSDLEMKEIRKGLKTSSDPYALSKNIIDRINVILATKDGRDLVARWDRRQMKKIQRQTKSVVRASKKNEAYKNDPAFQSYVLSPIFALLVADNINQYGKPDGIKKWVASFRDKFNLSSFAEYESQYRYVRHVPGGAEDMKRRRRNIVTVLEQNGLCTSHEAQKSKAIINRAYKLAS